MKLRDINGRRFRSGIYTDGGNYYHISRDLQGHLTARNQYHRKVELDIPGAIPTGKIDASGVWYIPRRRLDRLVRHLEDTAADANAKRDLIQTFLLEESLTKRLSLAKRPKHPR